METYAITIYVITEEILRVLNIQDDPQSIMSNAEVITFVIITAKFFSGNYKLARYLCQKLKLFPKILSASRLNRRIHKIAWCCWFALFRCFSLLAKQSDATTYFAVDSFPVAYCQKNRIDKRKHFLQSEYIGFAASKKSYFCGVKVHMVVTNEGRPVEVHLRPASQSDIRVLREMDLEIPSEAILYADGAYNSFDLEDILKEEGGIQLLAKRASTAKNRVRSEEEERQISSKRQIVETAFSCILSQFPRYIKTRTEHGFLIKVFSFILSYSASFLWQGSLA